MRRVFFLFFNAYQDRYLPIVYVLGADMCRVVADVFGPKRLVELLLRPQLFLAAYDEAARRSGGYRFPPSIVQAAVGISPKPAAPSG